MRNFVIYQDRWSGLSEPTVSPYSTVASINSSTLSSSYTTQTQLTLFRRPESNIASPNTSNPTTPCYTTDSSSETFKKKSRQSSFPVSSFGSEIRDDFTHNNAIRLREPETLIVRDHRSLDHINQKNVRDQHSTEGMSVNDF